MALTDELRRVAEAAVRYAEPAEDLTGVIAAEPTAGERVYLCSFSGGDGATSWLALRGDGSPVTERHALREAVSIAAMCEVAEETAAGGDLDELRSRLVAVRLTDDPPGIDEAEEAVLELQHTLGSPPRVATPAYLDAVGAATRRLERSLGEAAASPFSQAMQAAMGAVEALLQEVESTYKRELA